MNIALLTSKVSEFGIKVRELPLGVKPGAAFVRVPTGNAYVAAYHQSRLASGIFTVQVGLVWFFGGDEPLDPCSVGFARPSSLLIAVPVRGKGGVSVAVEDCEDCEERVVVATAEGVAIVVVFEYGA